MPPQWWPSEHLFPIDRDAARGDRAGGLIGQTKLPKQAQET